MTENPVADLVFHSWPMHALFAASRLGVFTLLASQPMRAEELSSRIGANARAMTALLDACVAMGLLRLDRGVYANPHVSDAHLVEGRPRYLGDFIEVLAGEAVRWLRLPEVITGKDEAGGAAASGAVDARRFTLGMHNLAMSGEADALAEAVDLSAGGTMADVGCGSGMYSVAFCHRYPGLGAVLLDRPDVLQVAREI